MNDSDARKLLTHELELQGYTGIGEPEQLETLLRLTGKVPLALKWAAAIAASGGSLEEAARRLSKIDVQKRQFLSFSFATMYDALNPLARDAALLCPYIGDDWNAVSVAMILDKSEEEVESAIRELKDRGILMSSSEGQPGAFRMLPLTREFLSIKFNENQSFHETVTRKIADLFVSPDGEKVLLNLPPEQRAEILYQRAEELRTVKNFARAEQMLKLASKWSPFEASRIAFLRGRVIYESGATGRLQEAIWNMSVVEREQLKTSEWAENAIYYAEVLDSYGEFKDGPKILTLLREAIPQVADTSSEAIDVFSKYATEKDILDLSKKIHNPATQHKLVKGLEHKLGDTQFIFEAGRDLMSALRLAASCDQATPSERVRYGETADRIGKQYKQIEQTQNKARATEREH